MCCTPILEVVVVGNDVEWLRETFEVMLPVFEGVDDGQHFSVIDLVVTFCVCHGLGAISYRMPEVVVKFLKEDATYGIAGGVDFEARGAMGFPHSEDRFVGEFVFEVLEG